MADTVLKRIAFYPKHYPGSIYTERLRAMLEVDMTTPDRFIRSMPFVGDDVTAGTENEFQTVVKGGVEHVDLPQTLIQSPVYKTIRKRLKNGAMPRHAGNTLDDYLFNNRDQVWENSWVRFPYHTLCPFARNILKKDLKKDKSDPQSPCRSDAKTFFIRHHGESWLRIPVSYLFKLALADAVGTDSALPLRFRPVAEKLMHHFLNDNTSPELFSFYPVAQHRGLSPGQTLSRETARRFLLAQFLLNYAHHRFKLRENGQTAMIYSAPHPPVRQKYLNEIIPDAFYRELFMSPCLSGWNHGEEKSRYMALCHEVLSRSKVNAVRKLKDAGIILTNLAILPNMSNISLANNGTHVSLGSRKITRLMDAGTSAFGELDEKFTGDLAIKIMEHFLPLFVGTYTAAPYRLDYWDFHPERVLGFMPHELDFTHLRMIWQQWKKKANLDLMGRPVTPFGPAWIDRLVSRIFRARGDMVPDFRLIDYLVALMSTDQSPSLDGNMENESRLMADLSHMGVFDSRISLYQMVKLRQFSTMGFSGFEGRFYSLFPHLLTDMAAAVDLQVLINGLAMKLILKGAFTHEDIPDDPHTESERRQIFFSAAIGLSTIYIRQNTLNRLMQDILKRVRGKRASRRYPGYFRIHIREYQLSLIDLIREDGPDLIHMAHAEPLLRDLYFRIENSGTRAAGKIVNDVSKASKIRSPFSLKGDRFNACAERHYRETIRKIHMQEGLDVLQEQFQSWTGKDSPASDIHKKTIRALIDDETPSAFLKKRQQDILDETIEEDDTRRLILLTLLGVEQDMADYAPRVKP